ncbi:MAG TPA: M48 family metallopeptidase [Phycisphaerae bacterium]|nr:M48 family metallopeptidase [Phycisphaerae bacterium]
MAVDFHTLISHNKRNSWILVFCFVVFVAVLGAVIGYATGAYAGGPEVGYTYGFGLTALAVIIAVVGSLISYYGGASAILSMSKARRIDRSDDPQLFNVVEEMAIAAGVPVPKVYLIDDTASNAFAAGRDPQHGVLAITTGLRGKLSRDELQGVIAHEMSHIRHFDIRFAVLMATLVGVVVLLCDMYLRSMWRGGGRVRTRSRRSRRSGGGGAAAILLVIALLLAIVAPILAKFIEMAFSRQREFLADAGAVELTRNPDGLAGALAKISTDPEVLEVANRATAPMYIVHPIKNFEDRASSIFDSHPPIKDRIQRILSLKTGEQVSWV